MKYLTMSLSLYICIVVLVCTFTSVQSRPVEDSTGATLVELQVVTEKSESSEDRSTSQKRRQVAAEKVDFQTSSTLSTTPPERARVETEGQSPLESKPLKSLQNVLLNFIHPTPLVDKLKEEEKYGNNGEKFNRIGRGFVDGVAALTNFLGSAVDAPVEVLKSISRKATKALNDVGTKLIGL